MAFSKNCATAKKAENDRLRQLTPGERLALAAELSDACRELGKAGAEVVRHGNAGKPEKDQ